jgi:uncharacterized protein (DUF1501 family)
LSKPNHSQGCPEYDRISRRRFLGLGAGAFVAAALPAWLPRVALADIGSPAGSAVRDVLVSVSLRGGADGLTLCPPFGDEGYYALRPTLAVPRPDSSSPHRALNLDGFFGFAPSLRPLLDLYQDGSLLVVHATGLPLRTRSHFSAMFLNEVGQPAPPASRVNGWIAEHLRAVPPARADAVLRAVGNGIGLPRSLVGAPATAPVRDLAASGFAGDPVTVAARRRALTAMYAAAPDPLRAPAASTLLTVDLLERIRYASYQPAGGAVYPDDELGRALRSTAALIKAGVGVEAATIECGGWDSHSDQGPFDGAMALLLKSLAEGLAAFHADLFTNGPANVVLVVQTEFGRNAWENGSRGTDHGHAGAMLVLGGHVAGGRVLTRWPGLAPEELYEGQDLALTIDARDILSEILKKRLGNPDPWSVFADPAYTPEEHGVIR